MTVCAPAQVHMLCFDTSTSSEDRIADSNQHLVIGNDGSHLNPGLPFQVTFLYKPLNITEQHFDKINRRGWGSGNLSSYYNLNIRVRQNKNFEIFLEKPVLSIYFHLAAL